MRKVAVIGLGKLGLAMSAVFASKGHDVTGVDISKDAVQAAKRGVPLTPEPLVTELIRSNRRRLKFDTEFDGIVDADISFVIVPTPTKPGERGFANDWALTAIESVGRALSKRDNYHVVVMVSTVMPGSMDKYFAPALEKSSGKNIGREMGLCYNPEFVALGSVVHNMLFADMQLIGESDKKAGDAVSGFHRTITPDAPLCRMSFLEAELTKLLLNVALSSRITYANLVGRIADVFGVDAHKILGAIIRDHRIGKSCMKPGSPVSGPCLPRDVKALTKVIEDSNIQSGLPAAMTAENAYLLRHIRDELAASGPCKVAILGWSYKPGTPLTDESAAFPLAEMLMYAGCTVSGYDPEAEIDVRDVDVANSALDCIRGADKIYVHTAWPEFAEIPKDKLKGKKIIDYWGILKK